MARGSGLKTARASLDKKVGGKNRINRVGPKNLSD